LEEKEAFVQSVRKNVRRSTKKRACNTERLRDLIPLARRALLGTNRGGGGVLPTVPDSFIDGEPQRGIGRVIKPNSVDRIARKGQGN